MSSFFRAEINNFDTEYQAMVERMRDFAISRSVNMAAKSLPPAPKGKARLLSHTGKTNLKFRNGKKTLNILLLKNWARTDGITRIP